MAYARLHMAASTLLVLVVALVVPAPPEPDGIGAELLPVTLGHIAVQVVCAAHVVLVRLVGRARRRLAA